MFPFPMPSVLLLLLIQVAFACRLDSSLHGVFKKQSSALGRIVADGSPRLPVVFDDVTITATSISDFGECVVKSADAYIFALKRMGRPPCFRCVTPVIRAPNIIQLAHQQEDVCHESAEEARLTCFDAALVSATDGFLIYRSENTVDGSCGVEGRFSIGYELIGGDLTCTVDGGSTADSCEGEAVTRIQFRNCSFPDFGMNLRCVGSWQERDGRLLAVFLNEENGEYRCGVVSRSEDNQLLHLSNDSSCARLSPQSAFEVYTFRPQIPTPSTTACSFPEWLRGEYDSLSITSSVLRYAGPSSAPVLSRCVHVDGERILVHSRTKCGEELGFHCLWFRARSDSLIEFKTTTPTEIVAEEACSDSGELSSAPWTTALVRQPSPASCGIRGLFTTPPELRGHSCFNVSVECSKSDTFRLSAYDCRTGTVTDSRIYGCVASWRDEDQLFIYATRARDTHSCFILRYDGGRLFFASTGAHCGRGFNFTENAEKTIILREEGNCSPPPTMRPKPARRPVTSVHRVIPTSSSPPPTTTTEESLPQEQQTATATRQLLFLTFVIAIMLF